MQEWKIGGLLSLSCNQILEMVQRASQDLPRVVVWILLVPLQALMFRAWSLGYQYWEMVDF